MYLKNRMGWCETDSCGSRQESVAVCVNIVMNLRVA
jgi:hypothetical protein